MNANLKILILLLVFLSSCKKLEWNNPFDSSCPKETWTPTDFKAIQEGTTVKLTWTQPINQISGFKILKGVGGGTATSMQDQSKGAVQLIDNTLTGGKVHLYSLTAYAGNNTSNTVTAQFTPILTAGITTAAISAVTTNTMSSGGNITTDGGAPITARGVCWNTSTLPTITNNKTTDGTGPGTFTSLITGLTPGATYYIRAYAINSIGTSYGNEVTTATAANLPALTTTTVSAVTATTATSGGVISSDGGGTITSRGVCWSTTANPTIANSKTSDATGIGTFTSSITGLTSATTYYVRAYATNSAGTAYGQQEYCVSSYGTASDVDGNTYQTVKIGTQIWTRENLKTTKFKDGTAISLVTDNTAWGALTTPGYCWYNNDATTYKNTYGALYNWNTVGTNKLCPTGWHVPTDVEWTILTNFLGGESIAGGKMKETGTLHWAAPNTGATNETGFTSLQGGFRGTSGTFDYASFGFWWSSSEYSTSSFYSWARQMANNNSNVIRSNATKQYGFSVRCVFGDLTLPTLSTASTASLNTTSASSGGNVSSDGGIEVTARGVCWSTTTAPTIADSKTVDGTGTSSFTSSITGLTAGTTYYVKAYATNSAGTAYGTQENFTTSLASITVTDIEGNIYNTVTIGTQLWMTSNLKTTKFNDNAAIPLVSDNTAWVALNAPGFCWYNNDAITYKITYGALYNWYTVNTYKLCPTGWHVPTDNEWKQLEVALGMTQSQADAFGPRGTDQGTQMKAISGWGRNGNGTNSSNFSGLPGGIRTDGNFANMNYFGSWWSSTENTTIDAIVRDLSSDYLNVYHYSATKNNGYSVRCIKGNPTIVASIPTLSTVPVSNIAVSSAIIGGNISGDGGAVVTARGVCWSITATPTIANSKTIDGTGTGNYTSNLTGLTAGTTYYARAYATNSAGTAYGNELSLITPLESIQFNTSKTYGSILDIDGNSYKTIQIGTQLWMAENLRSTKYNDGTLISNVTDPQIWLNYNTYNLTTGARCWYNNDSLTNNNTYGILYNWYVVQTGKICPNTWHVASDAEWTLLTTFLGINTAGNSLKESGTIHWQPQNSGATNSSGFTALPGGFRGYTGSFEGKIQYAGLWWTSNYGTIWILKSDFSTAVRSVSGPTPAFSIRCIKD
jgi:uncharacterized protein (TIGR02145 family)